MFHVCGSSPRKCAGDAHRRRRANVRLDRSLPHSPSSLSPNNQRQFPSQRVLYFQHLAHSFAHSFFLMPFIFSDLRTLSCTLFKALLMFSMRCALFVSLFCMCSDVKFRAFMRVRTLCKKHPGGGIPHSQNGTALSLFPRKTPDPWRTFPSWSTLPPRGHRSFLIHALQISQRRRFRN